MIAAQRKIKKKIRRMEERPKMVGGEAKKKMEGIFPLNS